jgi:hypothetical protein
MRQGATAKRNMLRQACVKCNNGLERKEGGANLTHRAGRVGAPSLLLDSERQGGNRDYKTR